MATEQRLIDAYAAVELLRSLGSRDYRREKGTIADAMKMLSHPAYTPTVPAVVLPCKIGDEVWGIRRSNKGALSPHRGIVSHMVFSDDMKLCIVVQHICRGEWGKKVFATYEDACAAIREGRSNG